MIFEDIVHKYKILTLPLPVWEAQIALVKRGPNGGWEKEGALIGYFKDETIARNVALALEFYKEKNKMIDGVLQND